MSTRDTLVFTVYVGVALVLPGTLVWRWAWGDRPRPFLTDPLMGLVVGYALELPAYMLARAVGLPWLASWWALLVVAVALRPSCRHLWRSRRCTPMARGWSWSLAVLATVVVAWFAHTFWWHFPLSPGDLIHSYSDEQYALALIGDARHHAVPSIPWVDGERLKYHWFVFGHGAAASWTTGIEPVVLLRRLLLVPMIVTVVLGLALAATQVTKRAVAGPIAAALLVCVGAVHTGWVTMALPYGQLFTDVGLGFSPTATYGAAVFAALLLPVLHVLDPGSPPVPPTSWVVLALLLGLQSGAKSTFLPVILAGLLVVVAYGLLVGRSVSRAVLSLARLTTAWLVFAQVVVFRGASAGVGWGPFDAGKQALRSFTSSDAHSGLAAASLVLVAVVVLFSKFLAAAALVRHPRSVDPRAAFLVGSGVSGVGAYVLLQHPALSQAAFAKAGALCLCVAAAWGLTELCARGAPRRLLVTVVVLATIWGLMVTFVIWNLVAPVPPQDRNGDLARLVWPPLLVIGVISATVVTFCLALPRCRHNPEVILLGLCAALIGSGALFVGSIVQEVAPGWGQPRSTYQAIAGQGGLATARWLRDHTREDDLLATNAHKAAITRTNRAFWLAANSERHVLVEGWGYTEQINASSSARENPSAPFWDPGKLSANDAVFRAATSENVRLLHEQYDVRWLVLDRRLPHDEERLGRYAELRFQQGDYGVYRLPLR